MNKKLQKVLALTIVMALVLAMVATLVACDKTVGSEGTVSIVVAPATEGGEATEYVVDLSKLSGQNGLMTVLEYLKENKGLTYTEQASTYGAFLTQVNDLAQDESQGLYLYLYTSVAQDADTSSWATTMEYKGHTLTSSGLGSSSMHIEDGAIIYIGTIKY